LWGKRRSVERRKDEIVTPTIVLAIEPGSADRVARTGGALARDLGARVLLAHVRKDPPLFNSVGDRERSRGRARRRGRSVVEAAHAALPPGVEADHRVELGVPATRLREIAGEVGAALVVVGSRGRRPLAAALLGSVSAALAREAPCPVMIVGRASSSQGTRFDQAPRHRPAIVAALDGFSEPSDAPAFGRELAGRLDGRLLIVPTHAAADPPALTLSAIAVDEGARLIVIDARHGDGRGPLPASSLATRLSRLATAPVVVVPEKAAATLEQAREARPPTAAWGEADRVAGPA
jgi:nucleotide-binding universal stress UspA family protein